MLHTISTDTSGKYEVYDVCFCYHSEYEKKLILKLEVILTWWVKYLCLFT